MVELVYWVFHAKKAKSLKGLGLKERICSSLGSIFFPLIIAPMRKENNLKGHLIETLPKSNYTDTVKTLYNITRYNRIFNVRHKFAGNGSVSIKIPSL